MISLKSIFSLKPYFFAFIFLLLVSFVLTGCNFPYLSQKKKAALQITSNIKATVFLNEEHLGQTPYFEENLKPGEYNLKLVPESTASPLVNWQGIVKLNAGILTVVNRNLGPSEEKSSGYILTLEPIGVKDKAQISFISTPDKAVITLNGEPKGFTPLSLENIEEGEHLISVSAYGFVEETIKAKPIKGYKLLVNVQLAKKTEEEKEEETATASAKLNKEATSSGKKLKELSEEEKEIKKEISLEKPYVYIKENPWGYLNVRSEPSTSKGTSTVVATVKPGEAYKYLETAENGWYKIEYEKDKSGWVSPKYSQLYQ